MIQRVISTAAPMNALNGLIVTPNPVVSNAEIQFNLDISTMVAFTVTDMYGRVVQQIQPEKYATGQHRRTYFSGFLPAGIYQITAETDRSRRSCLFVKM